MRSVSQTPIAQPQEIHSFPDDLEAIVANIECRLMDELSPRQFELVQHLVEANRLLVEAELTLGRELLASTPERKSA
ncbi:MAG: hypothetical protein U0893_20555 [Chloroflexota bacterium]